MLVSGGEQRRRNDEAERGRRFDVNSKIEFLPPRRSLAFNLTEVRRRAAKAPIHGRRTVASAPTTPIHRGFPFCCA